MCNWGLRIDQLFFKEGMKGGLVLFVMMIAGIGAVVAWCIYRGVIGLIP